MAEGKWSPSNSFELLDFMDGQCERCDKFGWEDTGENKCALVNKGMDAGIGIGECPDEWRVIGHRVFCSARSPAVNSQAETRQTVADEKGNGNG